MRKWLADYGVAVAPAPLIVIRDSFGVSRRFFMRLFFSAAAKRAATTWIPAISIIFLFLISKRAGFVTTGPK